MKIKLKVTRENEDGSADAVVDYDKDGLQVLIQYGVIAMLEEAIMGKNKDNKRALQDKIEESVNSIYTIVEDIKLLYKTYGDRRTPMTEDEVMNALIGLESKAEMVAYWAENAYEQYFEMNDYASEEVKARRAAIMGWGEDDGDAK